MGLDDDYDMMSRFLDKERWKGVCRVQIVWPRSSHANHRCICSLPSGIVHLRSTMIQPEPDADKQEGISAVQNVLDQLQWMLSSALSSQR